MIISQENLRKYGESLKFYQNNYRGESSPDTDVYKFSLTYSLVPFLLEVFSQFQFSDYSIEKFNTLLTDFNSGNSINITLEDLLAKGYIRIILDRVYIANEIYWSLPRSLDEIRDDIEEPERNIKRFLSTYKSSLQYKTVVEWNILETLLKKHNIPAQDFLDLGIFSTLDNINYIWV